MKQTLRGVRQPLPRRDGSPTLSLFQRERERTTLRAGFTLIEMLMAVTLVLIMMVMFAEVFQLAGGSVSKQRVLADNDQNARTLATIIRGDLDKRTFRLVIPFYAGEPAKSPTSFDKRRGYFYISNNNLGDGTDDVLQFTVMSTVSLKNSDESPYFGAAARLPQPVPAGWSTAQQIYSFLQNPNQPDRDDGQIVPNGAGASRAAEISYFMRGTRLYRRVMLLRDPIPAAGVDLSDPAQPTDAAGNHIFRPTMAVPSSYYSGNFWGDFDYSAHRLVNGLIPGSPAIAPYAYFNGLEALRNDLPRLDNNHPYSHSLGQTWNRFGHNHVINPNDSSNGLPREFSAAAAPNFFIGRFTQEETSNARFQYPQFASPVGNGNPMDASGTVLTDGEDANGNGTLDPGEDLNGNGTIDPLLGGDGVVDQFSGGPRAGVDLLLSNVHEFRVEVWDDRVGNFVGIGHSQGNGDFHTLRRLNASYAPLGGVNNVFDTWHPQFNRDFDANNLPDPPPFRPLTYYPPGQPGPNAPYWAPGTPYSTEDTNSNGILDPGEDTNNNGVLDADVVFPFLSEDTNGNLVLDPGEDTNGNGVLDRGSLAGQLEPFGHTFVYRCIKSGTSGSLPNEPRWPLTPGQIISSADPAEPVWVCEYNVRPLRAIRITVRYMHPTSQQMKQVTIVHSLLDTTAVP